MTPEPDPKACPFIDEREGVVYLRVRARPGAKRDRVEGTHGDQLKVSLIARPVEGEANKGLVAFLAKTLGVRKSAVSIDSGLKSRDKSVRIEGVGAGEARAALSERLP